MTLAKLIEYRLQFPQLGLPRTREDFEARPTLSYEDLMQSDYINLLKTKDDCSCILRTGGTSSLAYKILPTSPHRFKYNDRAVSKRLLLEVISYLGPKFVAKLIRDKVVFLPGNMFEDGDQPTRYVSNALVSEKGWMGEWVCPVPQEIFDGKGLSDQISKLRAIALCYEGRNPAVVSGVPSVILQFAQVREEIYEQALSPQVVIVGGCAVTPYAQQLRDTLGQDIVIIPYYNATEGTFAYQPKQFRDDDDYSTLELKLDCGIWYEFVDEDDNIIGLGDVKTGVSYELLISTYDGLCRYKIGDVVQFTDAEQYWFRIVGRTSEYIDIANEHTQIQHVQQTMSQLSDDYTIGRYCVFPLQEDDNLWHYVVLVETNDSKLNNEEFALKFDQILQIQNCNYEGKRNGGTLGQAQVQLVEQLWFDDLITQLNHERQSTQSKLLALYPTQDNPVSKKLLG